MHTRHRRHAANHGADAADGLAGVLFRARRDHQLALLAAAFTHILADYADEDTRAPFGILALWPFYDGFLLAPHPLFLSLDKSSLAAVCSGHNLRAVARELLVTLPPLLAVVFYKLRPMRHDAAPTQAP